MSKDSYRVKFEDKNEEELSIKAESVVTIGDLKNMIAKHSVIKNQSIYLYINGNVEVQLPDSASLKCLDLSNFKYFKAYSSPLSIEIEEGAVSKLPKKVELIPQKVEEKRVPSPVSNIEVPAGLIPPTQKKEEKPKEEMKKKQDLKQIFSLTDLNSGDSQRPQPSWPNLNKVPLREREASAIELLTKKFRSEGVENAAEWARMSRGREDEANNYRLKMKGSIVKEEALKHFQTKWMRIIIKHYMTCNSLMRHKEKLLTQYGLLDFILGKATQCYPALYLMQEDRKKLFYEIATEDWFFGQKIETNQAEEKTYIQGLKEHTDPNVLQQITRITKNEEKARRIVECSQNQLDIAIKMALEENVDVKKLGLFEISPKQLADLPFLRQWQEQSFLFIWLMGTSNYTLRLKLFADNDFLKVYTLSMKHQNPLLFKLLVKHRRYILKILKERHPRLFKEKPEF